MLECAHSTISEVSTRYQIITRLQPNSSWKVPCGKQEPGTRKACKGFPFQGWVRNCNVYNIYNGTDDGAAAVQTVERISSSRVQDAHCSAAAPRSPKSADSPDDRCSSLCPGHYLLPDSRTVPP